MKIICLFTLCLIVCTIDTNAQNINSDFIEGQIHVKLKQDIDFPENYHDSKIPVSYIPILKNIAIKYRIDSITIPYRTNYHSILNKIIRIYFTDNSNIDSLVKEMSQISGVEYAEKIPIYKIHSLQVNDEFYSRQNYLNLINAPLAWNLTTGNPNIVVAVVDNAFQTTHPDLSGNLVSGIDVADMDPNPNPPADSFFHGTHVAGIIGAKSNNGKGIASIGYNIKIMPIKATGDNQWASRIYYPEKGILHAAENQAKIINMSFGSPNPSLVMQDLINMVIEKYNCIFIASAGNENSEKKNYPAAHNNVIAVANTTIDDQRYDHPIYGSSFGTWVDISAPGTDIYSTMPNGTYRNLTGTSMSAPLVSGLCALMKSVNPSMTGTEFLGCIQSTAVNIDSKNPNYIGKLGAGRIDAFAAVKCVAPYSDLLVVGQSLNTNSVEAGKSIIAYCSESNNGNSASGSNVTSIHLSKDDVLTPGKNGDLYLDEIPFQALSPKSNSIKLSKSITIPNNINPGNYYLFFSADGGQVVQESDEFNNFATTQITILQPNKTASGFTLSGQAQCIDGKPQIKLTWTPSYGASEYELYRNGSLYYSGLKGTEFTNTKITLGNSYTYYIKAISGNISNNSNSITEQTPNCLNRPGNFILSINSECISSNPVIKLEWTNASGASYYDIYRNGSLYINSITGNTFSNTLIKSGTQYTYSIVAKNSIGSSTNSNGNQTLFAPNCNLNCNIPIPPSNLNGYSNEGKITLNWLDNSDNETSIEIERSRYLNGPYTIIQTLPANKTNYTDVVTIGGDYCYRIKACCSSFCSNYSATICLNISANPAQCNIPNIPTNLYASSTSNSQINISWIDNSANEESFEIERSNQLNGVYSVIAVLPPNSQYFSDYNLNPNTIYYYKLRACCSTNCSNYSNISFAETQNTPCSTPPLPILNSGSINCPGPVFDSSNIVLSFTNVNHSYDIFIEEYPFGTSNIVHTQKCEPNFVVKIVNSRITTGKVYRYYLRSTTNCLDCFSQYSEYRYFHIRPEIHPKSPVIVCNNSGINLSVPENNIQLPGKVYYDWYFGPNSNPKLIASNSTNSIYVTQSGLYFAIVKFIGSSECNDTIITEQSLYVNVSISNNPETPILSTNSPICEGSDLILSASVTPNTFYFWYGPNNFSSTNSKIYIPSSSANLSGVYSCIVKRNNCTSDTAKIQIDVNPSPIPMFDISINGRTVTLNNRSQHSTDYEWNFGDKTNSYEINPQHQYTNDLKYTICLTAKRGDCRAVTNCQEVKIGNSSEEFSQPFSKIYYQADSNKQYIIKSIVQSNIDSGFICLGNSNDINTTFQNLQYFKLDKNGNILWARELPSNFTFSAQDIIKSSSGYIISFVYSNNLNGIMEIDEQGNKLWSKTYTNSNLGVLDKIIKSKSGAIYCYGHEGIQYNRILIKMSNTGTIIWQKGFNYNKYSKTEILIRQIIETLDEGLVLIGMLYDNSNYLNTRQGIIIKFDKDGNHLWTKELGIDPYFDDIGSVVELLNGDLIIGGISSKNNSFF